MSKTPSTLPIALTIAGSDSSGGAGIQADLKTFTALSVYGASVITALTAQNTRGVTGIHAVPSDFIRQQFDAVVTDLKIDAIKTGMLGDTATVEIVSELLKGYPATPVVVDPVMVATSGDLLLTQDALDAVRQRLIPLASIITPNIAEAAKLLGASQAQTVEDQERQANQLLALGARAVLVKGGHGEGSDAVDVLASRDEGHIRFTLPKIDTRHTHGTGCTLASAIAAGLAKGETLIQSITSAKLFVWHALQSGAQLSIGEGSGPVDHLYTIRRRTEFP